MQQILDRTEEALAQAFEALASNARRQRHIYYATAGALIAIVFISAVLLAGLAAAKHLDNRRSQVGQYVAGISLLLQGEVSFLRRTDLTVRYNRDTPARPQSESALTRHVLQSGVGEAPDAGYALLVPEATRTAWGNALPEKLAQLQQIATAAITTQQAFELDHRAYIVDINAEYAIVIGGDHASQGRPAALHPGLVTTMRDRLNRALIDRIGQPIPRRNEQVWLGPGTDPVLGTSIMTVVSASYTGDTPTTLIAAVIPVEAILARVRKPSDPAVLLLVNTKDEVIDVSPPTTRPEIDNILARARSLPREKFEITRAGVLLVQPLRAGFGSLVYFVSTGALAASLIVELAIIGAIALLLMGAIAIAARYWDKQLLRRSHAEATRALEHETINQILVNATPVGLCIVRLNDYAILTSNLLADTLLRLGDSPTLPRHVVAAFPPGPLHIKAGRLATAQLIVPSPPDDGVVRNPVADATFDPPAADNMDAAPRFLQITYAPVRYRGEDVLLCAIQDVTARQQLEERLRAAQRTAESMMRARSNFFAAMSHEIRTPLNGLLGNIELLARGPGLEAHASRLRALGVAADGLRRIVNDILDFSKIDAGEMKLMMEPFHPIEDLESLALSYAPMTSDRPIRFYPLILPSLDRLIVGDRMRLMQIINNLLSNAFKFTSSGKIMLNATLSTDANGKDVFVCQVRDSGIGMPPTLVARIFHPFVQAEANTSSRYGGTGLGLSICARLCELMGGHITVESVDGVGSAFTITVPVEIPDDDLKAPPPARGVSTLIVCQIMETGATVEAWLHTAGWRTHCVNTFAAARTFLNGNRPNVLVVSGEHDLASVLNLRAHHALNVVWVTSDGPPYATRCAPGVYEVTGFSHVAVLAAMETALDTPPEPAATDIAHVDAGVDRARAFDDGLPPIPHQSIGAQTTAAANAPPFAGLRILVAEDNPLNQVLIGEQLKTLGCVATVVGDGRQALGVLEHDTFDLVLTDIHMPISDGYALLAALQSSQPELPVFAFSAITHAGQTEDWHARGFAGYIAKPASLDEIEAALRRSPRRNAAPRPETPAENGNNETPSTRLTALTHYDAILRTQLDTDFPQLEDILQQQDTEALFHWAHRAAGAFRIVRQMPLVSLCREIESLCRETTNWTDDIATRGRALQAAVREYHQARQPA